jgi:WhiB family redox-sensing transcriptional regulator
MGARQNTSWGMDSDPADHWVKRSICRDEDPELFFPIGSSGPALIQTEQAKAVCRRCPVVESCLKWAISTGTTDGVWGGTDEYQRRRMRVCIYCEQVFGVTNSKSTRLACQPCVDAKVRQMNAAAKRKPVTA